ncbi:MAG: Ig-like domain-containing protein [Spirochaetaceae bacterium]|nr:Ig-like domain-containing protein [Spirochaetaceae bacterium]
MAFGLVFGCSSPSNAPDPSGPDAISDTGETIPSGPDAISVSLTPGSGTYSVTEEYTLTCNVTPSDAPIIKWESSDVTVATVNSNGSVKAVGLGTAIITVTAKGGITKTSNVSVVPVFTDATTGELESKNVYSIIFDGTRFIAGGDGGFIAHSTDGITWTRVANNIFGDTYSDTEVVAYDGNGHYIAGSGFNNTRISYSTNGRDWNAANVDNLSMFSKIQTAAYGNGRFVVGSSRSKIAYSTNDGLTWTPSTTVLDTSQTFDNTGINQIIFADGKFVAVGGGSGKIAWSTDGDTWTVAESVGIPYKVLLIAFGGGKFLASSNDDIADSNDCRIWTNITPSNPSGNPLFAGSAGHMLFAKGHFFLGTEDASTKVSYSQDGISWKSVPTRGINTGAYGNGKLVFGSNSGWIIWANL